MMKLMGENMGSDNPDLRLDYQWLRVMEILDRSHQMEILK